MKMASRMIDEPMTREVVSIALLLAGDGLNGLSVSVVAEDVSSLINHSILSLFVAATL